MAIQRCPAHRLSLTRIRLFEPGNHQRRFRLELAMRHIVVRQRKVKGILLWNKSYRACNSVARFASGLIVSAVIRRPIKVPRAFIVGNRIIASGLFSNPKDGRHDVRFPRVTLDRRVRTGRDKDLRFHLEQLPAPAVSSHTWRSLLRLRMGKWIVRPESFRPSQQPLDSNKPQEVSSCADAGILLSDFCAPSKPNFPSFARSRAAPNVFGTLKRNILPNWLNRGLSSVSRLKCRSSVSR